MGSLYEFQRLPYHPASPLEPKTLLIRGIAALKIVVNVVIFVAKAIPLCGYLLLLKLRKFFCQKPKDIRGWTALVTGGANGLGRAVAIELAKEGCHVVVADLDEYNAMRTALEVKYYGVKAAAYKVDVASDEEVREMHRKIEVDMGPVDILVNNAGVVPFLVSDEYTAENLQRMLSVNVLSHFYTVNAFLPGMYVRQRGHIVAISSAVAYFTLGFMRNYTATKYAVRGFMEELWDEIGLAGQSKNIRTTTVFPFQMNTRKELVDAVLKTPYFNKLPIDDPVVAARTIVQAIRLNRRRAFVPDWFGVGWGAIFEAVPRKIKNLLRDQLLGQ